MGRRPEVGCLAEALVMSAMSSLRQFSGISVDVVATIGSRLRARANAESIGNAKRNSLTDVEDRRYIRVYEGC